MNNARIHIFYTGGTIGMIRNNENRWVLDPDFKNKLRDTYLRNIPNLPVWDLCVREPTLDSSNMSPADWLSIAKYIENKEKEDPNKYNAYVVLHGTDTMAYTASALTFMINGLRKPVILTGSQIPMSAPINDALRNVTGALRTAATYPKPEVCLFFYNKLMLGCRTVKVHTSDFDAFDSPNLSPLAVIENDQIVYNKTLAEQPRLFTAEELSIQEFAETTVGVLRFFPGLSATIAENVLRNPLKGAVLHAFGSGNGPQNLEDVFKKVTSENKILVACTQCLRGSVNINDYDTGLGKCGVISGFDMTIEAAVAKLFWLLSVYGDNTEEIKIQMQLNLRGELTIPLV